MKTVLSLSALFLFALAVATPLAATEQETAPKVALVSPTKLESVLPEPPEGWKAGKAQKIEEVDDESIHISSVSRTYYAGEGDSEKDPIASITILDSLRNADFFDADEEEKWEKEEKSEAGYDKRRILDGMRVIEHYSNEARTGSLSVFVGQRFFVQIELTNEEPSKLYEWLKRIDLEKLAALK